MQSMFCSNCSQPLPPGAAFCGNCGASQRPANPAGSANPAPMQAASAETIRAGAPPSGADYAPTQLQPPPAPGSLARQDAYGSPYAPPPPPYAPYGASGPSSAYPPTSGPYGPTAPPPPPPAYAPGPPPASTPGVGVAPWAQPPRKSHAKLIVGCLAALVLVGALLGGGGFLLIKALSSRGGSSTSQGNSTSATPGAGSTPGSSATVGGNPAGTQTLANINRQAIYAGVNITILSAKEAASLPEHQESDPMLSALAVQAKISNQTTHAVYPTITGIDADGNTYELASSTPSAFSVSWSDGMVASGTLFFDVPDSSKVGDFQIQFGSSKEAPVTVPLTGAYDPNQWQQVTHQINQTVTYYDGKIKGTVTQIVVGLWTPGYQAPKGMRFLLMYLHVMNNTALAINVGDGTPPQYLLVFPNGDRSQPTTLYGSFIDAVVQGGESQDVGYDTFLIPTAPAPYILVFLNPDGSTAGMVMLGTI